MRLILLPNMEHLKLDIEYNLCKEGGYSVVERRKILEQFREALKMIKVGIHLYVNLMRNISSILIFYVKFKLM